MEAEESEGSRKEVKQVRWPMTETPLDLKLRKMREDAEKQLPWKNEIERSSASKQSTVTPEKKEEKTRNLLDLDQFMDAMDHGSLLQIYKKNNKIVIETSPLLSKFLLYSMCINVVLFVVLLTKVIGLW